MITPDPETIRGVLDRMVQDSPPPPSPPTIPTVQATLGSRSGGTNRIFVPLGLTAVGLVLVGLALLSSGGPGNDPSDNSAIGVAVPVANDEFVTAVSTAIDNLLAAPGYQAVQRSYVQGVLGAIQW